MKQFKFQKLLQFEFKMNDLIHIVNHEDDDVHSDTTDEYAPVVQLGKQFKQPLAGAISMEDIRSNSTNRKSLGSSPEEKYFKNEPNKTRSKSREYSLEDSQKISYKLMKKDFYAPEDFQLIEEAILNLQKPAAKRSKSSNSRIQSLVDPISQRQLVDSMEQISRGRDQHHVYRLILKIHSIFENVMLQINQYGQMTIAKQIKILLEILADQSIQNNNKLLSFDTHKRCLLQKAFLSFLDNMTQSQKDEMSFRQESSPSPAERKLQRKLEKESSPVRAFLNDPEEELKKNSKFQITELGGSSIVEEQDNLPSMIQISTMFDKGTLQSHVISSRQHMSQFSSQTLKNSDQYKLLLKCMNLWKIFTKQEIQRRELAQNEESLQIFSEIELSKDMEIFQDQHVLAMTHYESKLLTHGLKSLIMNIFAMKNYQGQINVVMRQRKQQKCFKKWLQIINKIKKQGNIMQSYDKYRQNKVKKGFVRQLREMAKVQAVKVRKFRAKKEWKEKKRIVEKFGQLVRNKRQIIKRMQTYYEINRKGIAFEAIRSEKSFKKDIVSIMQKIRFERKKKLFDTWAYETDMNRGNRFKIEKIKTRQRKSLKNRMFFEWLDLTSKLHYGSLIYQRKQKRKVFKAFTKFFENQETKERIIFACHQHLDQMRAKNIINAWRIVIEDQQKYRNFQLHIYNKMDKLKLKQVFKSWFNLIDILKRWRYLNENTDSFLIRKTRRRVFQSWKKQIRLKNLYFEIHDSHQEYLKKFLVKTMIKIAYMARTEKLIQKKAIENFKIRMFWRWQDRVNKVAIKRVRFKVRMLEKFKKQQFDKLRIYALEKIKFRNGMKSLLKLRANNLCKKAWVKGLKRVWRDKKIEINMWKAAIIYDRIQLAKKCFKIMKKGPVIRKIVKVVGQKSFKQIRIKFYKLWLSEYLSQDCGKNFIKRAQTKQKRSIFVALSEHMQEQRVIQSRLKIFDDLHAINLQKLAIQQLRDYNMIQKQKKSHYDYIKQTVYWPFVKKKAFRVLKQYFDRKSMKKSQISQVVQFSNQGILQKCLKYFKYLVELKKRLIFMKKQVKNRLMYDVLANLNRKSSNKAKIKIFQQKSEITFKSVIFDGLARYKIYRKYFFNKELDLAKAIKRNTMKNYFQKLQFYKIQQQFDRECVKIIHQKKATRILQDWNDLHREGIDQAEEHRLANELFMRTIFKRLLQATKKDKEVRAAKSDLKRKELSFYEYNSKLRGVTQLYLWMKSCRENKLKKGYAKNVVKQRTFDAWVAVMDRLRRKRILEESAELMQKQGLFQKGLQALKFYANKKVSDNLIIDRFQQRSELATKAEVLAELHNNIQKNKKQREAFYANTVFLAEKRMHLPFLQWKVFTQDAKSYDRANAFYMKRSAQYLKRLSWDTLRINKLHQMQKHIQFQAVDNWHGKLLLQKVLLGLKLQTHKNKKNRNITQVIKLKQRKVVQREYFDLLKFGLKNLKKQTKIKQKGQNFFKTSICRKVFIALAKKSANSHQISAIKKSHYQRVIRGTMLSWYMAMERSQKLTRMTDILQFQADNRLAHKFFPKLVSETFVHQVLDHMSLKRIQAYQQEFINQVRKSILMKKILASVKKRNLINLKRAIFIELQLNVRGNQNRSLMIGNHLDFIEDQTSADILQIAFNSLKERVVMKRFKKIAINCHKLKQMRNCLGAMEQYTLRRKINAEKAEQVRSMVEQRYLLWMQRAYYKEIEKDRAQEYVQATMMYQVMQQWRAIAQKNALARKYAKNVTQRNLMSYVMQGWNERVLQTKVERAKVKHIKVMSEQYIQRQYMIQWLDQTHEIKLTRRMVEFYQHKVYKSLFGFWRTLKSRKNAKRMRIHLIRERLNKRPELGRPLKALKNMLLFKAFNKLFDGAKMVNHEDQMTEQAMFAYYLKVVKKTFYSLRLNAQVRYQEQKTYEISDLFLKKRWLTYIKIGTQYLKERRTQRHKASIFRFLSLQKKGIEALISHSCGSQEFRIKKQFAMKLYYKRLLDLGFAGLRAYKNDKQSQRGKQMIISPADGNRSPRMVTLGAKLDPVVFSFKDLNQY